MQVCGSDKVSGQVIPKFLLFLLGEGQSFGFGDCLVQGSVGAMRAECRCYEGRV